MKKCLIVIMLSVPIFLLAQEFKSLSAKAALNKYKAELKKAEDIKAAAEAQYKKDLEVSLASAMKAGDLDEANLIKATISGEAPAEVAEKEDKKPNSVEVLEDRHPGNAGVPDSTTGNEYNLILRARPQKAILVIEHKKYDDKRISVGNITLNGVKIGSWDLGARTDKEAETMEIDISKYLTRSYAKYKVAFNYKTGGDGFVTYCVKVVYK